MMMLDCACEEKLSALVQLGMLPDTFSLLDELRRTLG